MTDLVVAVICAAFVLTAWGLIALCDKLMEHRR
jgi:hypothetical protein